jgi:hypothetical protein
MLVSVNNIIRDGSTNPIQSRARSAHVLLLDTIQPYLPYIHHARPNVSTSNTRNWDVPACAFESVLYVAYHHFLLLNVHTLISHECVFLSFFVIGYSKNDVRYFRTRTG